MLVTNLPNKRKTTLNLGTRAALNKKAEICKNPTHAFSNAAAREKRDRHPDVHQGSGCMASVKGKKAAQIATLARLQLQSDTIWKNFH